MDNFCNSARAQLTAQEPSLKNEKDSSSTFCFLCNVELHLQQEEIIKLFDAYANLDPKMTPGAVLSKALDMVISQESAHSDVLCKQCYKVCSEFHHFDKRMTSLKNNLQGKYKATLKSKQSDIQKRDAKIDPIITVQGRKSGNIILGNKSATEGKKIVLPISKLKPLPPDFVIGSNVGAAFRSSEKVLATQAQLPATKTSQMVISPSKLKQQVSFLKSKLSCFDKFKTSKHNDIGRGRAAGNDLVAGDDMPDLSISTAHIGKESKAAKDKIDFPSNDDKDASNLYDLLILPGRTADGEQSAADDDASHSIYIQEDIEMDDGDDKTEEMILLPEDDENVLLKVVDEKLLYPDDEISLVVKPEGSDEDNGMDTHEDFTIDNHDSNGSHIELQLSGDEETANAIIEAANTKNSSFLLRSEGKTYRVHSVQSKLKYESDVTDDDTKMAVGISDMVLQMADKTFKCMLCVRLNAKAKGGSPVKTKPFSGDRVQTETHMKMAHHVTLRICAACLLPYVNAAEHETQCEALLAQKRDGKSQEDDQAQKTTIKKTDGELVSLVPSYKQGINQKDITSYDRGKQHSCDVCKKKFTSKNLLEEHMNAHNGIRPYKCEVCEKSYSSKYTYAAHLKTHTERERPFSCTLCDKSFFAHSNLVQHERTHSGVRSFVCPDCDKAFQTQHNLDIHSIVHSGRKPYECGVCNKAFARRAEIKDHIRTHTGERPFKCDMCESRFSQRSNLLSHKRATHYNDKRHACNKCGKRFKRRRLLVYHTKSAHTGERPHKCEICNATFVYPEHYKKHLRIHDGHRPYICELCGKSFSSSDNRNAHRFVHSDKKPYECVACGAGFMRKPLLYAHMNSQGHMSETIVVNQPRYNADGQLDSGFYKKPELVKITKKKKNNSDSTSTGDSSVLAIKNEETVNISSEDRIIIQSGDLSMIEGFRDSEGGIIFTTEGIESAMVPKPEAETSDGAALQGVQLVSEGDAQGLLYNAAGDLLRLVQFQLPDGQSGWVALND